VHSRRFGERSMRHAQRRRIAVERGDAVEQLLRRRAAEQQREQAVFERARLVDVLGA
jgi:hypothetical protein